MVIFARFFFLPLEYKDFFFQVSLLILSSFLVFFLFCFILFFFQNALLGCGQAGDGNGKLFPLQKCFFLSGM